MTLVAADLAHFHKRWGFSIKMMKLKLFLEGHLLTTMNCDLTLEVNEKKVDLNALMKGEPPKHRERVYSCCPLVALPSGPLIMLSTTMARGSRTTGSTATATGSTTIARGGTATARGSRVTGGTTTATDSTTTATGGTTTTTGSTTTASSSRASGGTTTATGGTTMVGKMMARGSRATGGTTVVTVGMATARGSMAQAA